MSKETLVFVFGMLVFFVPFVGVPTEWKEWFLMGGGVVLMAVGYALRRNAFFQSLEHESGERRADVFVESASVGAVPLGDKADDE